MPAQEGTRGVEQHQVADPWIRALPVLRHRGATAHDAAHLEHFGIGLADELARAVDRVRHRGQQRRLHRAEITDTDPSPKSVFHLRVAA
ncbi:glutamate synthase domain-containing protein 1 [Streptomyces pseudovenezuelae]|uniref:Glutamate synthase domain-containing protein 1 n=1 Tax=Streptomyces pseudovenezuelae TaxID=67350 RepID=A0ABT6LZA1_9ACTN|nr:hypothetical protein [Streptomyces pseudovenezuelae]MDH6221634.1 glutamate synthase domain-containing protein 1 [Streptomyces pseudovenezuelae]